MVEISPKFSQVGGPEARAWVTSAMTNAAYIETSAKYDINVRQLFKQLLLCTYGYTPEEKVTDNSSSDTAVTLAGSW